LGVTNGVIEPFRVAGLARRAAIVVGSLPMATIRYTFRPSLFHSERAIVLDDHAITVREGEGEDRGVPWSEIEEVHIEPATAGDDDKVRWVINLAVKGAAPIHIDSVNVRGTSDFEHKTDEFLVVLAAIHRHLEGRKGEVRYRFGMRRGIAILWRIALVLLIIAGLMGIAAAIYTGEWEVIFVAVAFIGFGLSGLSLLRGRRGPVAYDPTGFELGDAKPRKR
jgi:hypothetical protein